MNNGNAKERAKLATELDKEGRWFQKTVRRYKTRVWAREMRRALGITIGFLAEETQVARATLYRAEQREETGAISIGELEALAEAMECKLVYAIVPERGTVAELAERRREHPRKTRTEREKEEREHKEWYAKEVERLRMQDPRERGIVEWRERLLMQRADRLAGVDREGQGKEGQGAEGQDSEGQGTLVRPAHSAGVQKLANEIGKYDVGAMTLEKVKRDVEEWDRKHPRRRERGLTD